MAKLLYIYGDDNHLLETVLAALKQNGYSVSHADVAQKDVHTALNADIALICQNDTPQRFLHMGGLTIDVDNISVRNKDGQSIHFTPTEFAVLTYLIRHNDRVVSRNELLPAVWGCENHSGTRMADDTINRLRKKLSDTHLQIHTVWGCGFKITEKISN